MSDNLSLVSTQSLLDELQRRFESSLFLGHRDHSYAEDKTTYHYDGNLVTLLGAISRMTYKIQREMDATSTEENLDA